MKRIKFSRRHAKTERRILIGMVTNKEFIRDILQIYKRQYMSSSNSVLIAKWCIDYYREFKKPPGLHIQDIFNDAVEGGKLKDESQVKNIERFLTKLSKEYERADKFNAGFMLKQAKEYFNMRAMENITEEAEQLKEDGRQDEATELLDSFRQIEIPTDDTINLQSVRELLDVFTKDEAKPLFRLPGGMGEMMNDEFRRQCFVGLMGPEKMGKTWFLLNLCLASLRDRCNTAFIQAGDMSRDQQLVRIAGAISKKATKPKYAGKRLVPVLDCKKNQLDKCTMRIRKGEGKLFDSFEAYDSKFKLFGDRDALATFFKVNRDWEPCAVCRRHKKYNRRYAGSNWYQRENIELLTRKDIVQAHRKFKKRMGGNRFRLATYANSVVNTDMIRGRLDYWREKEDFVIDVLIIDYPDIMGDEENNASEFRHSENTRWKRLRALSQDYNCLVLVVTQADAKSYDQTTLKRGNFSEDKRKYSHTTAFFTLNQTINEKNAGIIRLGHLMSRDNEQSNMQAHILQCLANGRPHISSFLGGFYG